MESNSVNILWLKELVNKVAKSSVLLNKNNLQTMEYDCFTATDMKNSVHVYERNNDLCWFKFTDLSFPQKKYVSIRLWTWIMYSFEFCFLISSDENLGRDIEISYLLKKIQFSRSVLRSRIPATYQQKESWWFTWTKGVD